MSREIVKGICDKTNCLYDAYTKEGADKNFVANIAYWDGDLNDITVNGFWSTTPTTTNKPASDYGYVITLRMLETYLYQKYIDCFGYGIYERYKIEGTWTEWKWVTHNVEVLTGSFTLKANTEENVSNNKYMQTSINVDFPVNLHKDNCVVLSMGHKQYNDNRGYGYGFSDIGNIAQSVVQGTAPFGVVLGPASDPTKIQIIGNNMSTSEKTIYYKIALLKVTA